MNGLYVDSNGNSVEYDRYYRKTLDKLKKEQRKHSKIHEKIANQRRNFLHKLSTQIANELDILQQKLEF